MFKRTVSPDDLARLKREREHADVAYNTALTALDAALQQVRELPPPPVPYDEYQVPSLNKRWDLLAAKPPPRPGWRGWLDAKVWATIAPLWERQQAFNSTLVDHINRNINQHRSLTESLTGVIDTLREELGKAVHFQARLIEYAQELTPYVDTKDYEVAGLMRRINEDVAEVNVGLAGTLEGVADELRKRWETTRAQERRLESQMEELRSSAAVAHQVSQTLKRELSRRAPQDDTPTGGVSAQSPATVSPSALGGDTYVGFEDRFRGPSDEIRARLESYLGYLDGVTDVLDVGCGRGEFLELLRDHGIAARGIDINHAMVEHCRALGLDVAEDDVLSHLAGLSDGSLGALLAFQVVEHLEPSYLLATLDLAFHKLRPGGVIVLETINVASWSAFFQSYVRDITHVRPLHPDTLKYLVTASGFQRAEVVHQSPIPPQDRLETVPGFEPDADNPQGLNDVVVAFNENVEKLNRLLFADQDYAVIGRRL